VEDCLNERNAMKRTVFSFFTLFLMSCTQHNALDLANHFYGRVIDEDGSGIFSANIEVIAIESAGHESIQDYIGRVYYSDENGEFSLNLPGGVEWETYPFSSKKRYTKYIASATVRVSKETFKDTVVMFENINYEESRIGIDIVLEKE
jgi:hypothetical protein